MTIVPIKDYWGWATKIRERLQPESLQTEIALMIAWDINKPEVTASMKQWLGEDGMMGRVIPLMHKRDEIVTALKAIGYKRPAWGGRKIAAPDDYDTVNQMSYHPWRDKPDGLADFNSPTFVALVDERWKKFWIDRGMMVPSINSHYLERLT